MLTVTEIRCSCRVIPKREKGQRARIQGSSARPYKTDEHKRQAGMHHRAPGQLPSSLMPALPACWPLAGV